MSRHIVVATFGSLLLATLVGGCDSGIAKERAAGKAPERPVLVAPVQYQSISQARSLAATIRPRTESDLGFRVNGKVAQRLVQNGDRVRNDRRFSSSTPTTLNSSLNKPKPRCGPPPPV